MYLQDTLLLAKTKRSFSIISDPLVHYGRHFGRTIFAFANVRTLITNGLNNLGDEDLDLEELSARYGG